MLLAKSQERPSREWFNWTVWPPSPTYTFWPSLYYLILHWIENNGTSQHFNSGLHCNVVNSVALPHFTALHHHTPTLHYITAALHHTTLQWLQQPVLGWGVRPQQTSLLQPDWVCQLTHSMGNWYWESVSSLTSCAKLNLYGVFSNYTNLVNEMKLSHYHGNNIK